jgi:hypothetical protein
LLDRELGVAPEKETRALIERIRAGEIAHAASAAPRKVETAPAMQVSAPPAAAVQPAATRIAPQRAQAGSVSAWHLPLHSPRF